MLDTAHITDAQRAEFLRKLDGSDVCVSDWEGDFLFRFRTLACEFFWTNPQRRAVDKMWNLYGSMINWPLPSAPASANKKLPAADPDACEFIVLGEGHEFTRCNEPATLVNQRGFRYCSSHADDVQRDLRRRGGSMILRPYPQKSEVRDQKSENQTQPPTAAPAPMARGGLAT